MKRSITIRVMNVLVSVNCKLLVRKVVAFVTVLRLGPFFCWALLTVGAVLLQRECTINTLEFNYLL